MERPAEWQRSDRCGKSKGHLSKTSAIAFAMQKVKIGNLKGALSISL